MCIRCQSSRIVSDPSINHPAGGKENERNRKKQGKEQNDGNRTKKGCVVLRGSLANQFYLAFFNLPSFLLQLKRPTYLQVDSTCNIMAILRKINPGWQVVMCFEISVNKTLSASYLRATCRILKQMICKC